MTQLISPPTSEVLLQKSYDGTKKSLAIIGTGIAGLSCAYFLRNRFDLTLYEQNNYAGGHTNTVTVEDIDRAVSIDTGFMVFNRETYPGLTRLFRELDVEVYPTNMSFSVQHRPTDLEFNGGSLNLLFGQRKNLFRPRYWKMLTQIDRFNREALDALESEKYVDYTLRDYIEARGYGSDMLHFYLQPMASAVWSSPPEKTLNFPAMTLLQFWKNHGFLGLTTQHSWLTVAGGAKNYVKKLAASFADRVQLNQKAITIWREQNRVRITTADGMTNTFDKVILACHADQALKLLAHPTELENELLGAFSYQLNQVILHTDEQCMPKTRRCWASWNYAITPTQEGKAQATTHYWMNSLQNLATRKNYFVSLNAQEQIAPEKIIRKINYEHPLFDLLAIRAQKKLPEINRISTEQTIFYAGAWFKYGFHEDGLASGLACARAVAGTEVWA